MALRKPTPHIIPQNMLNHLVQSLAYERELFSKDPDPLLTASLYTIPAGVTEKIFTLAKNVWGKKYSFVVEFEHKETDFVVVESLDNGIRVKVTLSHATSEPFHFHLGTLLDMPSHVYFNDRPVTKKDLDHCEFKPQQKSAETNLEPNAKTLEYMTDVGMEWSESDGAHVVDKKKVLKAIHSGAERCKQRFKLYTEAFDFEREQEWNDHQLLQKFRCILSLEKGTQEMAEHFTQWVMMDISAAMKLKMKK